MSGHLRVQDAGGERRRSRTGQSAVRSGRRRSSGPHQPMPPRRSSRHRGRTGTGDRIEEPQRPGTAKLGGSGSNVGSSTSGIVRFSPARYAPSPIAAMRSSAAVRPSAAISPDWWPPNPDRVGHLFARLATLGPAATWRADTRWCRRWTPGGAVLRSVSNARPAPDCESGRRRRSQRDQFRPDRGEI